MIKIISECCGNSDLLFKKNGIVSVLVSVIVLWILESDVSIMGLNLGSCVFLFCFCFCFVLMFYDMYIYKKCSKIKVVVIDKM